MLQRGHLVEFNDDLLLPELYKIVVVGVEELA